MHAMWAWVNGVKVKCRFHVLLSNNIEHVLKMGILHFLKEINREPWTHAEDVGVFMHEYSTTSQWTSASAPQPYYYHAKVRRVGKHSRGGPIRMMEHMNRACAVSFNTAEIYNHLVLNRMNVDQPPAVRLNDFHFPNNFAIAFFLFFSFF